MKEQKSDIYVFSGTGNSLLVARKIAGVFENAGVDVRLYPLTAHTRVSDSASLLGIVIPVAMQGTYAFIWKFIENLPNGDGRRVFLADTFGVFSGGIVGALKRILVRKGYKCVGAREFYMPHNLLRSHPFGEKAAIKIQKTLRSVERYASDLIDGRTVWKRVPVLSDLMSVFSRGAGWWRLYRSLFSVRVDNDTCVACGLCAELCPTDNFVIDGVSHPQDACELCMRCVTFCPKGAITIGGRGNAYHSVSFSDLLKPNGSEIKE